LNQITLLNSLFLDYKYVEERINYDANLYDYMQ